MTDRPVSDATDDFDSVLDRIEQRFAAHVESRHVFTTDAPDLFERMLAALPPEQRQLFSCSTCRTFITRYGGLAAIDERGRSSSALWNGQDTQDPGLRLALEAMANAVRRATVTGVFVASQVALGRRESGGWTHFSAHAARAHQGLDTAAQVMAAKRAEYEMLTRGLEQFDQSTVERAHDLLGSGNLFRSEKCLGVAQWLLELHQARRSAGKANRTNVTWVAVASAPPGFCHVRGGMIGTLLEDVRAALPFDAIKARFDAKMDPTQYMRPTAAPSAGNIAQAEKIVAELDTAGALARRFATIDEIDALWRPESAEAEDAGKSKGVFGHLLGAPKPTKGIQQPDVTMTWDKFSRTVLPKARSIEYFVGPADAAYVAIVTAANPDAPPILQWDKPERRNPASWYLYVNGSAPSRWNLKSGRWHPVTAVTLRPSSWYGATLPNQGKAAVFVLQDCRDTQHESGGGFFPESLRSEYHSIRRTMEAYANKATIQGRDQASACGISLQEGVAWGFRFRVTPRNGLVATYRLDRWD